MRDELLQYYNRELDFLRRMSVEFAARHPEEAGRLQLGAGVSADPHVERLLEGFALLAGRIQLSSTTSFRKSAWRCSTCFTHITWHRSRPCPSCSFRCLPAATWEQGRRSGVARGWNRRRCR